MDEVAAIGQSGTPSASSLSSVTMSDNFDTFIKLLTTQLKHQDPLEPMDTKEFVQELTQFTAVEQAIQNVEFARAYKPLTAAERSDLLAYGRRLAPTLGPRYGPVV